MKIFVTTLLIMLATASQGDAIDDYIESVMENQRLPGVAVAVVQNGEPAVLRTYGMADVEHNIPVTVDTAFRLASISKQITATAVMLLVEDGKVGLDDSFSKYVPDCPQSWHDIKIRHLLTHTSGLRREPSNIDSSINQTNLELIEGSYGEELTSYPGEKFLYSNLGYSLLGEVITRASGKLWYEFVDENIFEPLGMKNSGVANWYELIPNRADGYYFSKFSVHRARPMFQVRPGGGFISTLKDMMKWDAAISNLTLISKESRDAMWTPAILNDGVNSHYGFGLWNDEIGGFRRIRHGGNNPGFRTWYTRYIDYDVNVIVLVNGFNARHDAIAREVAGHFVEGLRIERPTITLSDKELQRFVGRYEVDPENILSIDVDGNGLSVESSSSEAQFKMVPETEDTFFISKDESYVFGMEDGEVAHLTIHYGENQRLRLNRLP